MIDIVINMIILDIIHPQIKEIPEIPIFPDPRIPEILRNIYCPPMVLGVLLINVFFGWNIFYVF